MQVGASTSSTPLSTGLPADKRLADSERKRKRTLKYQAQAEEDAAARRVAAPLEAEKHVVKQAVNALVDQVAWGSLNIFAGGSADALDAVIGLGLGVNDWQVVWNMRGVSRDCYAAVHKIRSFQNNQAQNCLL